MDDKRVGLAEQLLSAAKGEAWLVRGGGLRGRLGILEAHSADLSRRLAEIKAGMAHRPASSATVTMPAQDLRAFERRVFSQNGEDGMIEEIFRRIGEQSKYFVEFGVESGIQCNAARLVWEEQWNGLFMETDDAQFQELCQRYRPCAGVRCVQALVASTNIEALLEANAVPREFDLLSIDVDGNDYWIWAAITQWRPRVVVIEYNAAYPPPRKWVMRENPNHRWDGTSYYGASLASLAALGEKKDYTLVATDSHGVNAFFVRNDLVDEQFLDPIAQYHYSPPRFGSHPGGHPPGAGPFVEI